jgi:hypothetical protein
MTSEIGVWECELCHEIFPVYLGRTKGGAFMNCECGARYHWSAGSPALKRVLEALKQ